MVANMITGAGADGVISVDLHTSQIQGFFDIKFDQLTAALLFVRYIQNISAGLENPVIVAPDAGRMNLARKYAIALKMPLAMVYKERDENGSVEVVEVIGEVAGKTPIFIDDVIASGSIVGEIEHLCKKGASAAYLFATHGVLLSQALTKLQSPCIREIVVTNTVPVPESKMSALPKLRVLSIANLIGETIERIWKNESVSEIFERMPFLV